MKITDVTIDCYAWPKPKPISNAASRPGAVGEAWWPTSRGYYEEGKGLEELFKDPLKLDSEGCVAVPDRPGLGIEPESRHA